MKTKIIHIYTIRFIAIIAAVNSGLLFFSCSPSHVLSQIEHENQVFTYIDFQRNHKVYEISDSTETGLEKTIKILGFAGDKFLIEITPDKERVSMKIMGRGFDIRRCTDHVHTVLVRDPDSLFSISVSGETGIKYDLKITCL